MTDRNVVEVIGISPETSVSFVHHDATLSDEQCTVIEGILRTAEQQVLRYLRQQQTPKYPDNAVCDDRTYGYG